MSRDKDLNCLFSMPAHNKCHLFPFLSKGGVEMIKKETNKERTMLWMDGWMAGWMSSQEIGTTRTYDM